MSRSGPGGCRTTARSLPLTLKAGDKVLIGKWSGTEVKIDAEEYLILKEDEVLGVLAIGDQGEMAKHIRLSENDRARRSSAA